MDDVPSDVGSGAVGATVWSCDGDYAWESCEMALIDPTPTALVSALTAVAGATHPISLVLHLNDRALIGALSATAGAGSGRETFLRSRVPLLAPVVPAFGSSPGVTTVDPQPNASLRFEDRTAPVDIQSAHVVWRATKASSCADMSVSLQAVLGASQLSVVIRLPAGDRTIAELISTSTSDSQPSVTRIGEPTPPAIPVEIAATFQGIPLDFDFDAP